jgi:integrase
MEKITIVEKKRKNYTTLYLKYSKSKEWEPLNLYLYGKSKKADAETYLRAESIRAKRMMDMANSNYDMPVSQLNKDFLAFYKKMIDERPDYERRASVHKHLIAFCEKEGLKKLTFSDIGESFWNKFKRYLVEDHDHKQITIHTVFGIIKTVLYRAERDGIIYKNPLKHIKEKKPKSTRTYLTWEELNRLYNTPCTDNEVSSAFFFSCYTGLRLSDIENLKKKNFHFSDMKIIIPSMVKTDDAVIVDFNKNALGFVKLDKLGNDELVFKLPSRSIMHPCIKQWAAGAKIEKNVSFHTSRHTFATGILTYDGELATAQALLGHSNPNETLIYAKIIDEKRKKAIDRLPKLKKNKR